MKIAIDKTIRFFISLSGITLVFVLVIFFYNTEKLKTTNALLEHAQEVIGKSNNVLLDVVDIETGLRGYALTGKNLFLEPYNKAVSVISSDLAALTMLTKDNPNQVSRIDSLKKAIDESLVFTKKSIETKRLGIEGNLPEKVVINGEGKRHTDKIRSIIADINAEELFLLKGKKRENVTSIINSKSIFIVLSVLIFVVLLLVIALIRDQKIRDKITEELEESILVSERAMQKAEESTKLKEAFLANMSHEIRTPMNAIMGFSDILYKGKLGEKEKEYVKIIKSAGENLLTIINDILDISKIEAGMMTFEEHTFSVNEIFKSLNVMLMARAKEKNLELVFTCHDDVPDSLLGDPTRLTQIIINLAGNAIKFTPKGSVNVNARASKNENGKTTVEFTVKDTGIGIPADKLSTIFERFTQAENQTTRKYGGTGLGLSIAKQLVELQGGTLSVKSEVNAGSVFSFCIAYKNSTEASAEKKTTVIKYNMEDLRNLTILLAEDNLMNVQLISSLFSENKLKLEVAENGSVCIEKLKKDKFDIILMDMEMPVMNGYEAATIIRKELNNNIPIVAMTAHAMAGEREKCLSLGMNDYISKPINADILFNIIHDLTIKPLLP